MTKKPRVVFAFTEAGLGHIMPLKSITDAFEKKYGDKVECVRSQFFTETNTPSLLNYEKFLCGQVRKFTKHNWYGSIITFFMDFFGANTDNHFMMKWTAKDAYKDATKHVDELNADVFVSTHWATNFYAVNSKSKPLTITYIPDTYIYPVFRYKCDLTLCPTFSGYQDALSRYKKRYNKNNLKLVPYCIRSEAFNYSLDKIENRKKLNLPENKFTITLTEGGYGIGKMEEIVNIILKRDLPVTLIPICGKNQELYEKLKGYETGKNTSLLPLPFTPDVFQYLASSDLFLGKSGSMIAEPTFYGVPSIITSHATNIEKHNADYYVKHLKCAMDISNPIKIVEKVEEILNNPNILSKYAENALKMHEHFGAEVSADYIFNLLKSKYPNL